MANRNGSSCQRGVRVPLAHDAYLLAKAKKNPFNSGNQIATEINNLIMADYVRDPLCVRRKRRAVAKKKT